MWKWTTGLLPAAVIVLAQLPIDQGIVSLVRDLGVVAVLVWYVMYDVRVRTPTMLKTFAEEQAAMRVAFAAEQTALRTHYDSQISRYQEMLFKAMQDNKTAVKDMRELAQVAVVQREIDKLETR